MYGTSRIGAKRRDSCVRAIKERLRIKAMGHQVMGDNRSCELRESKVSYEANFQDEYDDLIQENTFY